MLEIFRTLFCLNKRQQIAAKNEAQMKLLHVPHQSVQTNRFFQRNCIPAVFCKSTNEKTITY